MPIDPYEKYPQSTKPTTFADDGDYFTAHTANKFVPQANALEENVNTKEASTVVAASTAATSAAAAAASATIAQSVANFVGPWDGLTGPLDFPATAYHLGGNWQLLKNLPDVTAVEPGTDPTTWTEIGEKDLQNNNLGVLTGGTQDIDLTVSDIVIATISTAEQTFTFSNPKATGYNDSFSLFLTNGGSQVVNWPSLTAWAGGEVPTLTSAGIDVLVFVTNDGGANWFGFVAGLDVK